MSAYTALEGQFDFNKTPLVPPGIKVIIHEKLNSVKLGWYMEYQGVTSERIWITTNATYATHTTPGGKQM